MKNILTLACVIALASCGSADGDPAAMQGDSTATVEVAVDTTVVAPVAIDTAVADSAAQ